MTEQVIKTENKINNILFWICFFVTFLAIFMNLVEFFSRGAFPTSKIGLFYVGVLAIYSLHKEALRFLEHAHDQGGRKNGEVFVYFWILMAAALYLVNFLTKDYFSISNGGERLMALTSISYTALEVGGVFILARILKLIMIKLFNKNNGTN
jgi:hypothetical protein